MSRVICLISEWILTSHVHVLQACEVEESHTAATLACEPDAVARVWGIEEKVAAYTTENARNIVGVTVYLSMYLPGNISPALPTPSISVSPMD